MVDNCIVEYKIGISPTRLTINPEWYYKKQYSQQGSLNRLLNLRDNRTKEGMSRKSGMKIQRCVEWLSLISTVRSTYCKKTKQSYTHKLSMITLTIPECKIKPDISSVNKNCLVPFLKSMCKYYGLESYVWIAEYQENGMIHYHITTNNFIHYSIVQKVWNRLLNKAQLNNDYFERSGNYQPPSTRCEGIRDDSKAGRYLSKYMSKESQQEQSGKARRWGASTNLLAALKASVAMPPDEYHYLESHLTPLISFANIQGSRATYFMSYNFKPLETIGSLGLAFRRYCHLIRSVHRDLFTRPPQIKPAPKTFAPLSKPCAIAPALKGAGQMAMVLF